MGVTLRGQKKLGKKERKKENTVKRVKDEETGFLRFDG